MAGFAQAEGFGGHRTHQRSLRLCGRSERKVREATHRTAPQILPWSPTRKLRALRACRTSIENSACLHRWWLDDAPPGTWQQGGSLAPGLFSPFKQCAKPKRVQKRRELYVDRPSRAAAPVQQRVLKGAGEPMSSDLIEAGRGVRTPVEEVPVVMPSARGSRHHWAVMLAGGDGVRLQSLTLRIAGDSRPKQFCSIFGGESLLTQTRARLESLFHVDRELFVVTRAHETYYRDELRNVDDSRIIPQPLNRGTGVAVAVALLHILQRDSA